MQWQNFQIKISKEGCSYLRIGIYYGYTSEEVPKCRHR